MDAAIGPVQKRQEADTMRYELRRPSLFDNATGKQSYETISKHRTIDGARRAARTLGLREYRGTSSHTWGDHPAATCFLEVIDLETGKTEGADAWLD
jgi:hypothetical protein